MDQNEARAALSSYEDLAGRWEHPMVLPELTDDDIAAGCEMAERYGVACVTVRPGDVELASRLLSGTRVAVGAVVSYPHGAATTAVKLYETRDLLRRGAKEIEVVVNTGKLRSRQFQYIESELAQVSRACKEAGARWKATLEMAYLGEDLKVVAAKICKRCEADFVKAGTGFAGGGFAGDDIRLMARLLKGECGLVAGAGIESLETALEAYGLGAERVSGAGTAAILDQWRRRLAGGEMISS